MDSSGSSYQDEQQSSSNYDNNSSSAKNKVFVGGLAWETDESSLRKIFDEFGELEEVRVVTDRNTGRSKGFGFVTFKDKTAADEAVRKMDGQDVDGRQVRCDFATERSSSERGGSRGGRRGNPYDRGFSSGSRRGYSPRGGSDRGDRGRSGGRGGSRDSWGDGGGGRDRYGGGGYSSSRGGSRYGDRDRD